VSLSQLLIKRNLILKKDGIIVFSDDGRSGLLLPNLKGIKTVDQQISIACQKGGIDLAQR